jgi:indole-3-glycerol phosphate synthase
MIWEAKALGASAVLLIVSILSIVELKKFLDLAHDLGLSAIVETHDGNEIRTALNVGAEIIGVNNRDLTDFTVNIENSINLRRCVSGDVIFISESGIKTPEDVRKLKENDVDAVLIGETLMKSDDKKSMILELKNG